MNILFLTLSRTIEIESRNIYNDLVRRFVQNGHNVYMVVPFERNTGRKTEVLHSMGATILGVRTLNIQKTNIIEKGIGTLLLGKQYMLAIKRHFRSIHFDLVLYSTPPITFNNVIKWAKRTYGAKSYLLLKDIFPQNAVDLGIFTKTSLIYKIFRKKEETLYKISDFIGCMSPANCRFILDNDPYIDPAIVEVCPNSVELFEKSPVDVNSVKDKYDIPQDKALCIYGGNLGKPQGIDFLIDSIASNERRNNSFFLVVGNGTELKKIKSWFKANSPKNAKLMNALPKEDYDVLIRSADIGLIFLDKRFTIPNYPSRLLSYLENKIPIMMAIDVNTDIGTIAEANGYGLWAESGNLAEFDKKLDLILADSNLRISMGWNGYKYLLENYTVDKSVSIIMSHFYSPYHS